MGNETFYWDGLMKYHAVTKLLFTSLVATKIWYFKNKMGKNVRPPHLPRCSAPTHEDRGCLPLSHRFQSKMERFISVPSKALSDRIFCRFIFDKPAYFPTSLHFTYMYWELGKGIKNGRCPTLLGWPGGIGKCRSIYLGCSH